MKILVIEDDYRIATYVKKGLEMKSFVVDVANDGEHGFDMACEGNYDVIILDRMLPNMDGLQVCQSLRAEKNFTPIIMLTARTQINERVEGLEAGADDYLGKPFAFTELLARIKALARRPKSNNTEILRVGDLSINSSNFEVKRSNELIELSKKEFALLEFLVRNSGKVFSPEQLTEQVWSYDADVLPNTAQVYIGYLRNKIDKNFKNNPELIKTIRGFGYKIDDK